MKQTYIKFGSLCLAVVALTSCADDEMKQFLTEKPESIAQSEYLNAYEALKTYVDRSAHPGFKLSGALTASDYSQKALLYRITNANFDEIVAGNAMKMASCVGDYGDMNFGSVSAFVDAAEEAGISIFGHTLLWHEQQPVKWLNRLIKDRELDIDPNEKIEKEDWSGNYTSYTKFPFYIMGYEPTIVNGCLHSENPGSWYQYFIADGFQVPADGNYTAIVKVKGSVANDGLTLNCGWGWGSGESASGKLKISTEWEEQAVSFTGIPSGKGLNLVLQPGGYDGTLDIESIRVVHYESPAVEVAVNDYDYSFSSISSFPYFVMGYEPPIVDGCLHSENPGGWYQYFIADNIPHPIEGTYVATVRVKASSAADLTLNMGWGWGNGESASGKLHVDTEWKDATVTYVNVPNKPCNLVLQPGGYDGVIDIAWVKVDHIVKMNTIPLTEKEKKDTITWAMEKWMTGMMQATGGKVKAWDLINEPMSGGAELQHGEEGQTEKFYWQDILGDVEYGVIAAKTARKAYASVEGTNPEDLKLFINDYNLEWQTAKLEGLINWIKDIEKADPAAKIDGIGTQMHISLYLDETDHENQKKGITDMLTKMAETGKLVRISELDMGICEKAFGDPIATENVTFEQHQMMSDFYKWIIEEYFRVVPAAQQYGICQWCLTDADGKITDEGGWRNGQPVGLWTKGFATRKPAYAGWADGLSK